MRDWRKVTSGWTPERVALVMWTAEGHIAAIEDFFHHHRMAGGHLLVDGGEERTGTAGGELRLNFRDWLTDTCKHCRCR